MRSTGFRARCGEEADSASDLFSFPAMSPAVKKARVPFLLALLILLNTKPLSAGSPQEACVRKMALVGVGLLCEVECQILASLRVVQRVIGTQVDELLPLSDEWRERLLGVRIDPRSGSMFAVTWRSPIHHLMSLRLADYDLRGKSVLDVASGHSRFAQMVNLIYGSTGTFAIASDLLSGPPVLGYGSNFVAASAFRLPFANAAFDLTTSLWFVDYYLPRRFNEGISGEVQKRKIETLADEFIRVTKRKGEVRLGVSTVKIRGEGSAYLQSYFRSHHRVESVRITPPLPITGSIQAVLR